MLALIWEFGKVWREISPYKRKKLQDCTHNLSPMILKGKQIV